MSELYHILTTRSDLDFDDLTFHLATAPVIYAPLCELAYRLNYTTSVYGANIGGAIPPNFFLEPKVEYHSTKRSTNEGFHFTCEYCGVYYSISVSYRDPAADERVQITIRSLTRGQVSTVIRWLLRCVQRYENGERRISGIFCEGEKSLPQDKQQEVNQANVLAAARDDQWDDVPLSGILCSSPDCMWRTVAYWAAFHRKLEFLQRLEEQVRNIPDETDRLWSLRATFCDQDRMKRRPIDAVGQKPSERDLAKDDEIRKLLERITTEFQ